MGDCVDFGIISNIEFDKDYSNIDGPEDYKVLYKQYQCVSIPDDIVNEWIPLTQELPTFLGTLQKPFSGIDHYGVTIIPPESLKMLSDIVISYMNNTKNEAIRKLVNLFTLAIHQDLYIICYGI